MRIGFALNSHWAIRLLNRFESGFSVDAPYVCIIYPAFVTPWFPRSCCVGPEMLHVFRYIDMLTCMIYNYIYMHLTEQQGRPELLVSAMKIIDKDR